MINPNYPSYETEEKLDLTPITSALESVKRAVIASKAKESVEVINFDEVRLALKKELAVLAKELKPLLTAIASSMPEAVEEVSIKNFPKQEKVESVSVKNLGELATLLENLQRAVEGIVVNPVVNLPAPIVNIPEQSAPVVNVPAPIIQDMDISSILAKLDPLKYLSDKPTKPITVRLTDGRKFVDAIRTALDEGNERLATVVSTSYGLTKGEYKSAEQELYKSVIATNSKVSVLNTSTTVSSAKARKSIILTNDSDTVIYVAKGATAVANEGIRLNASGGAIVIEDWDGIISAISTVTGKNLCYSEVI